MDHIPGIAKTFLGYLLALFLIVLLTAVLWNREPVVGSDVAGSMVSSAAADGASLP